MQRALHTSSFTAQASSNELAQSRTLRVVADVHGWDAKNSRLFADAVAQGGSLTVLPDFFHGDKFPGECQPVS